MLYTVPAARLTARNLFARHDVRGLDELRTLPVVVLCEAELDEVSGTPDGSPESRLQAFQEDARTKVALWMETPYEGWLWDGTRKRFYKIELDLFEDMPCEREWDRVMRRVLTEWEELRATWIPHDHLQEPEFAAVLRAFSQALQKELRWKTKAFRIGGRRIVGA
jgi:hypothetical protein